MKKNTKGLLAALACAGAAGGFFLRFFLLKNGFDEKGLLVKFHPLAICFWILAAVVAGAAALCAGHGFKESPSEQGRISAAVGSAAMSLGIALSLPQLMNNGGILHFAAMLGILAALSLMAAAAVQLLRKKTTFLFHVAAAIFFAVFVIGNYQFWRSETQLELSVLPMAAAILLMLWAYHRAALDAGESSGKPQMLLAVFTAFCSLSAVPGSGIPLFYLGGAVWAIMGLFSLPGERMA